MDISIGNLPPVVGKSAHAQAPAASTARAEKAERADEQARTAVASEETADVYGQVDEAVTSIQSFVQNIRRDLNFSVDDSSGRVVVKVTDGASGEVIRQLPSEEALRLAENLEEVRSLLFKAEA